MFTYEWLGMPSESGVPPVLERSLIPSTSIRAAITHAKSELKKKVIFPSSGQKTYGVRILDNDSILVWVGSINDD